MKKSAYTFLIKNKESNTMLKYIFDQIVVNNKIDIEDISKKCYISKSSVSKYFASNGFEGFKEFKYLLLNDVNEIENTRVEYSDFDQELAIKPILATSHLNNDKEFEKAYKSLEEGGINYIIGMGGNGSLCIELKIRLERLGYHAVYESDLHSMFVTLTNAKKDSNLWIFSYTGETPEILYLLREAQLKTINVIAITRKDQSTLSKNSNLVFRIDNSEELIRTISLKAKISMMYLVLKLMTFIIMKAPEKYNAIMLKNIFNK